VNSLPDCYPTASRPQFKPGPFCTWVQHANHSATAPPHSLLLRPKNDTHFNIPQTVKGQVDLDTAVKVCSLYQQWLSWKTPPCVVGFKPGSSHIALNYITRPERHHTAQLTEVKIKSTLSCISNMVGIEALSYLWPTSLGVYVARHRESCLEDFLGVVDWRLK